MSRLLHHYTAAQRCAYLAGRDSNTEYKLMLEVSPQELEALLEHGWRRFGPSYFQPVCTDCMECVSLRIPVRTFLPTKSQRRAARKCAGLRVVTGLPRVDEERLALYAAWHAERESSRGWNQNAVDAENYHMSFCFPHPCAREMAYYQGSRLVAIGIVDETPHALSSTYFFRHPDAAALSLGTASVLFEVEWARRRGRGHVYLGYRVTGCPSVAYKDRFGPHEVLMGRPGLHEKALWLPPPGAPPGPARGASGGGP